VVRRYHEVLAPFCPQLPVADSGLDAATFGPHGVLIFATREGFFSECLGEAVASGDLLEEGGRIFERAAELLAKFWPVDRPPGQLGLDAVYPWPHGEIWFSIEVGFLDGRLGPVGDGDRLSDTGRLVARNRELIAPFRPIEDAGDRGLQALQGLTLLLPGHSAAAACSCGEPSVCSSAPTAAACTFWPTSAASAPAPGCA
jgi:hypothetical protein